MADGRNRVCSGRRDDEEQELSSSEIRWFMFFFFFPDSKGWLFRASSRYCMISITLLGFELFMIIVVTPALVERRAAEILVLMPPVPKREPDVDTSAIRADMSATTSIGSALGLFCGC